MTRKAGTKSKRVGTERFGGVCFLWKELENEVDNLGKNWSGTSAGTLPNMLGGNDACRKQREWRSDSLE